jgi:hypothetical protein
MDENWLVIFEHDASVAWGRIEHDGEDVPIISLRGRLRRYQLAVGKA